MPKSEETPCELRRFPLRKGGKVWLINPARRFSKKRDLSFHIGGKRNLFSHEETIHMDLVNYWGFHSIYLFSSIFIFPNI